MRARDLALSVAMLFAFSAAASGCNILLGLDKVTFYGEGGDGGTGGTPTTTLIPPGCMPSQTPNPVRDDCGVFVSSSKGDDTNSGTSKDEPLRTIGAALASPVAGPIYLCAESFAEAVQLGAGATIYGGLDCTNGWVWVGATKKSELSPAAGQVPLVLEPGVGLVMEDVKLRANDAVVAGGSSIAMIATSGAEVELTRCELVAGNGADGAAGEAFVMSAPAGGTGNDGSEACTADVVVGGKSVTNACDEVAADDDSVSGAGGVGQEAVGGAGSPGLPGTTENDGKGQPDDAGTCTPGGPGDTGADATPGAGAQATGTISAQGYSGTSGADGAQGKPGQGGGGGGGAKGGTGGTKCADPMLAAGASGASGGAGGCGGAGGKGGQAGGASIALVSLGASFVFTEVTLSAAAGGSGGNGGPGQSGGNGGEGGLGGTVPMGASALKPGCSGGKGGLGGSGGKGGGGAGGPSIGIAYTGDAPEIDSVTLTIGTGGIGGEGEGARGKGADGAGVQVQAY